MPKVTASADEITILEISQGAATFALVGNSPMIFNRVNEKARRELLFPRGRKTNAERAENLKHNPIEEYRNSVYRHIGNAAPTRLMFPAPAFKKAMSTAALDIPGTKKAEIGRLTWVSGTSVDIYGIPKLLMSIVRSADIAKTPDVRTRAIVPEWACIITVNFVQPKLKAHVVGNLLAAAGIIAGVGDWRQEKGSGSHGQFRLVDEADADFRRIIETGGRKAQDAALLEPECYDTDTEELLSWFTAEVVKFTGGGKKSRRGAAASADAEIEAAE